MLDSFNGEKTFYYLMEAKQFVNVHLQGKSFPVKDLIGTHPFKYFPIL